VRRRPRKQGRRGSHDAKWGDPYPETTPCKRATAAYFSRPPDKCLSLIGQKRQTAAEAQPSQGHTGLSLSRYRTIGPRTCALAATLCNRRRTLSSTDARFVVDIAAIRGTLLLSPAPGSLAGHAALIRLDRGLGVERARAPSRQRRPSPLPTGRIRFEGAVRALFLSRFIRVGTIHQARTFVPGGDEVRRGPGTIAVRPGEREYGDIMACTVRDTSC
jgi:hypothetical protein